MAAASTRSLRSGDWVEVRTPAEIRATLDEHGALDGLPFMPEMLQYCGRRFRVYKSAHKTCDTIERYVIRRMDSAVHLEGLRCDGGAHGGCQAACLIFWKEAWLKRVDGGARETAPADVDPAVRAWLGRGTRGQTANEPEVRYRCQATEMLTATREVRRRDRWDPRFYVRDLTSGNVRVRDFVRYGAIAMVNAFLLRWRGRRYPNLCGGATGPTPTSTLGLCPGETVTIRPRAAILGTVNGQLKNRGLSFDVEMVPYCGRDVRVLGRIERIVDDKTGRLIDLPNPCLILDGVTCSGNHSSSRMFCPRSIYPYWREIWLERRDPQPADGAGRAS